MTRGVLFFAVACASCWALWVRRYSWAYQWERCISRMVVLGFACAVLISPTASRIIGPTLHLLTGKWNAEDFIGHMCAIGAGACAVYCAARRLRNPAWLKRSFTRTITLPTCALIPVLFVLFWESSGTDVRSDDFINTPADGWLTAYWLVLDSIYIYLMIYVLRGMIALRHRLDLRPQVPIYMVSCLAGMCAALARDAVVLRPHTLGAAVGLWTGSCICLGGFALGAGLSWVKRLQWFDNQKDFQLSS